VRPPSASSFSIFLPHTNLGAPPASASRFSRCREIFWACGWAGLGGVCGSAVREGPATGKDVGGGAVRQEAIPRRRARAHGLFAGCLRRRPQLLRRRASGGGEERGARRRRPHATAVRRRSRPLRDAAPASRPCAACGAHRPTNRWSRRRSRSRCGAGASCPAHSCAPCAPSRPARVSHRRRAATAHAARALPSPERRCGAMARDPRRRGRMEQHRRAYGCSTAPPGRFNAADCFCGWVIDSGGVVAEPAARRAALSSAAGGKGLFTTPFRSPRSPQARPGAGRRAHRRARRRSSHSPAQKARHQPQAPCGAGLSLLALLSFAPPLHRRRRARRRTPLPRIATAVLVQRAVIGEPAWCGALGAESSPMAACAGPPAAAAAPPQLRSSAMSRPPAGVARHRAAAGGGWQHRLPRRNAGLAAGARQCVCGRRKQAAAAPAAPAAREPPASPPSRL